jgi:hypothetical protein
MSVRIPASHALLVFAPLLCAATPYASNPTFGAPGTPVVDGANVGEWGPENLVYRGLANDDPRSLGGNWTMHETPWDLTHLYAAWDDEALYLAWQYVDVTDVVDPANAGSAGAGAPRSMDLIQWLALDTVPGAGAPLDMWGKNAGEPYWTGPDLPDHQLYFASNLWQGYVSTAVDGVFPVDDGGVRYFDLETAGIEIAVGPGLAADALLGVDDADHAAEEAAQRDFLALGHDPGRDSFYEIRIPLSALGLDAAGLAAGGLGVMLGQGEGSCLDTVPHDPATHDTPGTSPSNSPLEWGDVDHFTVPFVRVARAAGGEPPPPPPDGGAPPPPVDAAPAGDAGPAIRADAAGPSTELDAESAPPVGGSDVGTAGTPGPEAGAVPPAQDAGAPAGGGSASGRDGALAADVDGSSSGGGCVTVVGAGAGRGPDVAGLLVGLALALGRRRGPPRRRPGPGAHEP